nr:LPS export ABC transporter periplasmic protein LptC [Desulfobulbaceae bacterium]
MKIDFQKIIRSRNMLWQLPLLVIVIAPLWWGGVVKFLNIETQQNQSTTGQAKSSFTMLQVKISQAEKGQEQIRLDASRVYSEDDQETLFLDKPVAHLVGDPQKPLSIKGGSAIYETKKQIITLLDDVELLTSDTLVTTSVLRYFTKYKKVKSAAEVELNSDGMRITGTSFFYDLVNGDFRVGKRVVCNLW